MSRSGKGRSPGGQLRIIGGRWRGRKLGFSPAVGLRPTGDRIRETLFNWLAPHIHGAQCLDLYAGSGALGLEALSRGARACTFVDTSDTAIRQIQTHLTNLGAADSGHCVARPALDFLAASDQHWDIVFIDPPFGADLVGPSCAALERLGCLAPEAHVYVETGRKEEPALPERWALHREKQAGDVCYRLFIVDAG